VIEVVDPWAGVAGQERAVAQLRAAAHQPVHAYLFVGPEGSGRRAAVRAFAAEVLGAGAEGEDAERHVRLALAEQHPDLVIVEPEGNLVRREEAERLVAEAWRSPVEGTRKVVVGTGFENMSDKATGMLLKTIEEPPASTVFVLVATDVPPELVTIASRSVRIDFASVPEAVIAAQLEADGVAAADAALIAGAAGGNLARARVLAGDQRLALRRDSWLAVPGRLDGTGAAVAKIVGELQAQIDDSQDALEERHRAEIDELNQRIERYGQRGSGAKDLEARHKREIRRHRTEELRFGLAILAGRYRDALTAAADPRPAIAATRRITEAADALTRNPTETLLLQALLLDLPPLRA
jgi:DNA polymerase-3 subunit delta'